MSEWIVTDNFEMGKQYVGVFSKQFKKVWILLDLNREILDFISEIYISKNSLVKENLFCLKGNKY